ncbi:MAG TPA: DUF2330 domain-containing protein [Gemmataceae bacterium]|jgi:hypothetical protein|nr:DUF2330 domain-containing protein [Gemmataceae bacterium]
MTRLWLILLFNGAAMLLLLRLPVQAPACCPAPPSGKPVVNPDQTVILIWDPATKTEHFIRQASFKSAADNFGFLVPSPSQPELDESGNGAFPYLQKLTEPEIQKRTHPTGIACGCGMASAPPPAARAGKADVQVLQRKLVAGFHATVLEANSAAALVAWLKENGYAFSPEVEAWAKPYVEAGWKITALKVARAGDDKQTNSVSAAALRMSFQTDRPLFPYREPDFKNSTQALGASNRLLRIYFIADARYEGALDRHASWTGSIAWADKLKPANRSRVLELLNLPANTGGADWWLTEFEDHWPYRLASADLYFARSSDQGTVKRPPIIQYISSSWPTDIMVYAIAIAVIALPVVSRVRQRKRMH